MWNVMWGYCRLDSGQKKKEGVGKDVLSPSVASPSGGGEIHQFGGGNETTSSNGGRKGMHDYVRSL